MKILDDIIRRKQDYLQRNDNVGVRLERDALLRVRNEVEQLQQTAERYERLKEELEQMQHRLRITHTMLEDDMRMCKRIYKYAQRMNIDPAIPYQIYSEAYDRIKTFEENKIYCGIISIKP